jgi:hypothetical protein
VALHRLSLRLLRHLRSPPKLHLHRKQLLRRPSPLLQNQPLLRSQRLLRQNPRLLNDEFVMSKITKKPGSARLFC